MRTGRSHSVVIVLVFGTLLMSLGCPSPPQGKEKSEEPTAGKTPPQGKGKSEEPTMGHTLPQGNQGTEQKDEPTVKGHGVHWEFLHDGYHVFKLGEIHADNGKVRSARLKVEGASDCNTPNCEQPVFGYEEMRACVKRNGSQLKLFIIRQEKDVEEPAGTESEGKEQSIAHFHVEGTQFSVNFQVVHEH